MAPCREACAPVLVAADWPAPSYRPGAPISLDVHVVNDTLEELAGAVVEARLAWPGGGRKWLFAGNVAANACSFVGALNARLPQLAALEADTGGRPAEGSPWPLELHLELRWGSPARLASNRYDSVMLGRSEATVNENGSRTSRTGAGRRSRREASKWRRAAASGF